MITRSTSQIWSPVILDFPLSRHVTVRKAVCWFLLQLTSLSISLSQVYFSFCFSLTSRLEHKAYKKRVNHRVKPDKMEFAFFFLLLCIYLAIFRMADNRLPPIVWIISCLALISLAILIDLDTGNQRYFARSATVLFQTGMVVVVAVNVTLKIPFEGP